MTALTLTVLGIAGVALTGCSAEAVTSECALIIGNGGGEAHTVKNVVYPGESHGDEGDDWVRYLPCGPRNFIINPENKDNVGDRHNPVIAWTKASEDGKIPPMMVKVWLTANWELNQERKTIEQFWVFCQKYSCASESINDNDANFSTSGWNGMLRESMSPAIDRSASRALINFTPDLWRDRSKWGELARSMSAPMMEELRDPLDNRPFFCGRGSDSRNRGECKSIKFTIEGVEPLDPRVMQIEDNAQASTAEQSQDQQRIDRTNRLYGPYADYYRGLQDTIDKCKDKCQIIVGEPRKAP